MDNLKNNGSIRLEDKKGLSLNALKYIAVIAMFISHLTFAFPGSELQGALLYSIGRITAPIMFFALVEGYHKTSNKYKYALRLFIFAVISYFPFIYMITGSFTGDFLSFNVIFTIFLGFWAIHIRREVSNIFLSTILIIFITMLSSFCDWGVDGIIIVLIFDSCYGNKKYRIMGYLLWILLGAGLLNTIVSPFRNLAYNQEFNLQRLLDIYNIEYLGHLAAIPLLLSYNGKKGKNSAFAKWFFYIFYPAHTLLIGFLAQIKYM